MAKTIENMEQYLRHAVESLCSTGRDRASTSPGSLKKAAAFIEQELRATGGDLEFQPVTFGDNLYRNISLKLGSSRKNRIVIGAHYDTVEGTVGADDNASAVALLLAVARELSALDLPVWVELVAWTLEEPPAFGTPAMGSAVHAASLRKAGNTPEFVIAFEMVGYYPDSAWKPFARRALRMYPARTPRAAAVRDSLLSSLPEDSRFTVLLAEEGNPETATLAAAFTTELDFPCIPVTLPAGDAFLSLSDHMSYRSLGCPCLMLSDTAILRNPNYHTAGDTPETLDYALMARLAEAVVKGLAMRFPREEPV